MKINAFKNEYNFLSNFYPCKVIYNGTTFENSEAAFQAAKCWSRADEFIHLSASDAKRLGRSVEMREDWEIVKNRIMRDVVLAKFSQNEDLKEKLLATRDAYLEEGNTWGDRYWGTVDGVGENWLGHILMSVRDMLKVMNLLHRMD